MEKVEDARMRRIAFVGSRDYPDMERVRLWVRVIGGADPTVVIVSGTFPHTKRSHNWGVDEHAIDQAMLLGLSYRVHAAKWTEHGRGAGMIRNGEIVKDSDQVIAFWDGSSHGTFDTINRCHKAKVPLIVFDGEGSIILERCWPPVLAQGKLL